MSPCHAALAEYNVGHVKNINGEATVIRAGQTQALREGANLQTGDRISTTARSALGLTLRDDTTISLGANSELVVDEMLFEPAANQLGLGLSMNKGTFALTTGQIAKLAPDSLKIATPAMSIGIRGTTILVEASDD
ncbi:MAG: FecR domain-containing protein [Magnetospirillum sp.]